MAGLGPLFPALPNPATGVSALTSPLGQLGQFLTNLPQQLMQWQQLKSGQEDVKTKQYNNAMTQLQMAENMGLSMPGIASDPRYVNMVSRIFDNLGLPGAAPVKNGKVDVGSLAAGQIRSVISSPEVYQELVNTPPEMRDQWFQTQFGISGSSGVETPDFVKNAPFIPPWTTGDAQALERRMSNVSIMKDDPLAVLQDIQAHRVAIDAHDGQGSAANMAQSVLTAATSDTRGTYAQQFADKHNMSVAMYNKTLQQTANEVLKGGLITAQTNYTNAGIPLRGAETQHVEAETNIAIPAQAAAAYAKAAESSAQASKTNLQVQDQLKADAQSVREGLVPGAPADKVNNYKASALKLSGQADAAKSAAVTNFANVTKAFGLTPPQTNNNNDVMNWINSLPEGQRGPIAAAWHAVAQANQNAYIANRLMDHVNNFTKNVPPGPAASLPQEYAAQGYKLIAHDGKWYMTKDGKNLYPVPAAGK